MKMKEEMSREKLKIFKMTFLLSSALLSLRFCLPDKTPLESLESFSLFARKVIEKVNFEEGP
jgi:hypothetical protein